VSPITSSIEPKLCYHLANVQRMHVVSVCLHYSKIIWLPSQSTLTNWKIRYRSIICMKGAFIWWKDCENRYSISRDIQRNTSVFWQCRTWLSQMSSVNSGVTGPNFTKYSHGIKVSFALLMCTARPWYSFSSTNATNVSCISRHW